MQKLLFFVFGRYVVIFLVAQKHYKNRCFDDFDMLIFSFLGQNVKDNYLATSRTITWPHFLANILATNVARLLSLKFSHAFFGSFISF